MENYISAASVAVTDEADRAGSTLLLGIGTAVPSQVASQQQTMEFALGAMEGQAVPAALIKRIYAHSGIEKRHSVIADYLQSDPASFTFFPPNQALNPPPGTAARMAIYEEHAVDLAERAARAAIESAGISPAAVTHVVISTCTGFFAPGPDVLLLRRLGIPTTAQRTVLGFMGCYAGISGIRTCQQITRAQPDAVVLQIAVEICSLHYQTTPTVETVVSNAIFSDGAAAAIYAGSAASAAQDEQAAQAVVLAAHSDISPDSLDRMSWRIGDHGFIMTLDAGVPDILKTHAPPFAKALADKAELQLHEITGWAIHPGGRKIIEALQQSLALTADDVESSFSVLRDYGNMSSATILFVIQRELARTAPGDPIAAMAFGPGLTMEGALLRRI